MSQPIQSSAPIAIRTCTVVVDQAGTPVLARLVQQDKAAAKLFAFLHAQLADAPVLVGSSTALASHLDTNAAAISRALALLEQSGHIFRFHAGTTNAIALTQDAVSIGARPGETVLSSAKVLLSLGDQDARARRRLGSLQPRRNLQLVEAPR